MIWTFKPIYKPTIWGGSQIFAHKGVAAVPEKIGESWELSAVKGSESVVESGEDAGRTITQLIRRHKGALLGENNYLRFGEKFPLLVKFIDAHADLSVQVHPDDEVATRFGYEMGKTEMWYVVKCLPGATLANGFREKLDGEAFGRLVKSGEILDKLNFMEVSPGDVYYIPAGRVHAVGAGVFFVEIQQTSDVTFRIYDYKRKDHLGNERELHVEKAAEALDFQDVDGCKVPYEMRMDIPVNVVSSPYFTSNLLMLESHVIRDYSEWDTFVVIVALEGDATLRTATGEVRLTQGSTALVSADSRSLEIYPDSTVKLLEAYVK